jgi:type IV/VI secretion system ImpK/VasF family protein
MLSMAPAALVSRPSLGGLAVAFQEPLTIILRVAASENELFRQDFLGSLVVSEQQASERGYGGDEIAEAKFAVVVFLDETISESNNRLFAQWEQLAFELYGRSDGGEVFFQRLRTLLKQGNTSDAADLLEVYGLCLLLGFQGGEDQQTIQKLDTEILTKIAKIRSGLVSRKPAWSLPDEPPPAPRGDVWFRRLWIAAVLSILLSFGLLMIFKTWLNSGAEDIRIYQVQSRR